MPCVVLAGKETAWKAMPHDFISSAERNIPIPEQFASLMDLNESIWIRIRISESDLRFFLLTYMTVQVI